ncbi:MULTISPECIES: spike base protein, RCAP_Rcc01079 family [Halocynthiibacter]|uniref:Uncharacterized protein n=1 Tax=Halocynthiibacter halioticoli TaxID=2986804 RepID=A0AAE3IXV7_9RHOB|nr:MULTISPECIES: hypothetical protein [Halocynthiibacter]MCV6823115.1 hypothetical protein [Halocynthiibacter halioticoli]MCW4056116.1 hypothetical protein [Halocynthiibacter sp. SDUM655004]
MHNPFENRQPNLNGPSTDLVPVAPNDTTDLSSVALALYIETGGTLVILTEKEETRTVKVSDFMTLPTGVRRVFATGTTASGIHAFVV